MEFRLLGDVHGDFSVVLQQVRNAKGVPVVQLGDFDDTKKSYRACIKHIKEGNLYILGGNHDDYPELIKLPHYLGDFGLLPKTSDVFFVRGALSKDKDTRLVGRDWWAEEQLGWQESNEALEFYEKLKPRVVLSHDAPYVINHILYGHDIIYSSTAALLQEMLKIHEPEEWYFAHHHQKCQMRLGKTKFRCLDINELVRCEF